MYHPPFSKDVSLPANLQRAMAAEAEASREARAKVGQICVLRLTLFDYKSLLGCISRG